MGHRGALPSAVPMPAHALLPRALLCTPRPSPQPPCAPGAPSPFTGQSPVCSTAYRPFSVVYPTGKRSSTYPPQDTSRGRYTHVFL